MGILDDLDVETWLSDEGVDYKHSAGSSGEQLNVRECPFCGNQKFKVYMNSDSGLGNCFACGQSFNKWKFGEALYGAKGRELHKIFEGLVEDQGFMPVVKPKRVTADVQNECYLPDSIELPTPDGLNAVYLEDRGITGDYAGHFHLRYCQDAWYNFTRDDGTQGGQYCGQRILIPVYDLDGKMVTFQARDVTGTSETRYLFPAKLPGAGRYLLNGQNAMVADTTELIVGEGPFDVIALQQCVDHFGEMQVGTPIGTFGKHLSANPDGRDDQLAAFRRLKARGIDTVTIMWDGEKSAFSAALTAAERLKRFAGLRVKIAALPAGKDPNEADLYEVYQAWKNATEITPITFTRLKLNNPYRK